MRRSEILAGDPSGDPVSICQRKKAAIILARVFGEKGCA